MSIERIDANTLFGFWPKRKANIDVSTLLGRMEQLQVAKACTLSALGIFYDFVAGNDETLAVCRHHPELIPVATVNPCRWLGCAQEVQRLLAQGVRLFRFFPQYQEWSISQEPFLRLLDDVFAGTRAILMLPGEMGVTAIGAVAARVANPIIIDGVRYDKLAEAIVVMNHRPNVYLETHLINSPCFLQTLEAEIGLKRVVYGSLAPLEYMAAALAAVEGDHVGDDGKQLVLGGNIRRLLELNP